MFPKVQSGFYLTDALLKLDLLMPGCLLVPGEGEAKQWLAAAETKRLKNLVGALHDTNGTATRLSLCVNPPCLALCIRRTSKCFSSLRHED